MSRVRRRPYQVRTEARSELERRVALERLSGESLGRAPHLWLIREALDQYLEALRNVWSQPERPPRRSKRRLVEHEDREWSGYWLCFDFPSATSCKPVARRHTVEGRRMAEYMDVPNAALALYDATRSKPEAVAKLVGAIERATGQLLSR